jgi:aryl-alcohol dehydrogenase-like predicted oxidoreductase
MLPIPGTSKVAHLEENVAAAAIKLSDADFAALEQAGRAG